MSNNKIKSWDEISKLAQLPELKNVLLAGNPIYGDKSVDNYKELNAPLVVKRVPQIENVDGKMVSAATRAAAEGMDWAQKEVHETVSVILYIGRFLNFKSNEFRVEAV